MSTTKEIKAQDEHKSISENSSVDSRMVMPAVSTDEAINAWQAYQDLKSKIIDPDQDIQVIKNQEFKKKSYWRKVATFFNLSIETREEWKETLGRTLVWHFTVRATAPNGRFVEGVGSCDVYERASLKDGQYMTFNSYKNKWEEATPNSPHNTRSTAYTRAYNRAVSDLIGGGEVSAEEIQANQQHQYSHYSGSAEQLTNHDSVDNSNDVLKENPAQVTKQVEVTVKPQQFKCEKCNEVIPLNAMLKCRERYDGHTFCFKHQLEYKKQQVKQAQYAA